MTMEITAEIRTDYFSLYWMKTEAENQLSIRYFQRTTVTIAYQHTLNHRKLFFLFEKYSEKSAFRYLFQLKSGKYMIELESYDNQARRDFEYGREWCLRLYGKSLTVYQRK